MQQNFHLPCVFCKQQLSECGSLINSPALGPLVACEVCRALYFIEITTQIGNKPLIVIQPTNLTPEDEFEIIRYAESRTPLKEYLKQPEDNDKTSLGEIINSAITPSDLIRKLHEGK